MEFIVIGIDRVFCLKWCCRLRPQNTTRSEGCKIGENGHAGRSARKKRRDACRAAPDTICV